MKDYDDYAFFEGRAAFEMPGLPAELVERKWKEAYRRFYWRPSRILRQLTRWSTYRDCPVPCAWPGGRLSGRGKGWLWPIDISKTASVKSSVSPCPVPLVRI